MLLVCGFLGCLGHAFKRTASTSSLGAGDHPHSTQRHGHPHHTHAGAHGGDRGHHGRGGRTSHNGYNGQNSGGPGGSAAGGASGVAGGSPVEHDSRAAAGAGLGGQAGQNYGDGDLQAGGGAAAAAAAVAAATQPAMLVKLDRGGGASRRTPLHVAAERGQLHVLSAIIEGLCCSATAGLLTEEEVGGGDGGQQQRQQSGGRLDAGGGGAESEAGGGGGRVGAAEEFPVGPPGAGGVPVAPDQYIQFHLNMQDAEGTTALSLSCRFGHVDCCRLLLANGSGRTLSDVRGNTPLHYAALRGHLGVLFMLLDEFVEPGQEEELTGYVDARNHAGCTPLHYAVWGRQSGSVQVLLQHGADVLPRNSRPAQELTPAVLVVGSTPLHLAAARGHVEVCRILLKTFAERVLEPLQLTEDDPQPPTLASLDPRVQVNANGHMPYQVAQRLGFYPLAMLLRPSIPILRLFSDEERAVRFYGPSPLRAIAAEALNKKLLAELDALAAAAPPLPAAASAAGGSVFGMGTGARPLTAPPTLEQRTELEAADAAATQPVGRHGLRMTDSGAVTSGLPDARGSGNGNVRRRVVPPPLPLEVGSRPGTATAASAGSGSGMLPAPAAAGSPNGSLAPRTPPVAVPPSPTPLSPGLMSPLSLVLASPSAGGPISPTISASGQHPLRSPSTRRAQLTRERSSNSMLPAATAPPQPLSSSARPASHQSPSQQDAAVLSLLPGQTDLSEVQPAAAGSRSARPSASGEHAGTAASTSVSGEAPAAAATGVEDGTHLGGGSATGVFGADDGSGPGGPRTPARQPSTNALHVRRAPSLLLSPSSSPSGAAGPAATASPSGQDALGRTNSGSIRPAGLVRLRSNPLFEEGTAAREASAGAASPLTATAGGSAPHVVSALPSPNGGLAMPPLPEDAAEGEDGAASEAAATVASSCAAVTPFERPGGAASSSDGEEDSRDGAGGHGAADARVGASIAAADKARSKADGGGGGGGGSVLGGAMAAVMSYADDSGDEDLECGVCMEPLPLVAVSPCRHQICGPCARRICCLNIQKPSHCPFCRSTIAAFVAAASAAQ